MLSAALGAARLVRDIPLLNCSVGSNIISISFFRSYEPTFFERMRQQSLQVPVKAMSRALVLQYRHLLVKNQALLEVNFLRSMYTSRK